MSRLRPNTGLSVAAALAAVGTCALVVAVVVDSPGPPGAAPASTSSTVEATTTSTTEATTTTSTIDEVTTTVDVTTTEGATTTTGQPPTTVRPGDGQSPQTCRGAALAAVAIAADDDVVADVIVGARLTDVDLCADPEAGVVGVLSTARPSAQQRFVCSLVGREDVVLLVEPSSELDVAACPAIPQRDDPERGGP